MKIRTLLFGLLIAISFNSKCFAATTVTQPTPLLPHSDPADEREFQNIYQRLNSISSTTANSIPSGLIMMSTTACPSGWTRFTALDNNFPRGSSSYGSTGGSASVTLTTNELPAHNHVINITDPGHTHTLVNTTPAGSNGVVAVQNTGPNQGISGGGPGGGSFAETATGSNTTGITANSNNTGSGNSFSILNPYITIIFCQKN